jgi:hypothetical protein
MNRILVSGLAAALGAWTSLAGADATLVYQRSGGSSPAVQKTLSVARFFVRVDSSDAPDEYLLYQAGKFFPLFRVDTAKQTYARLTPPVQARLGPVTRTQKATGKATEKAAEESPTAAAAGPDTAPKDEAPETPAAAGNTKIPDATGAVATAEKTLEPSSETPASAASDSTSSEAKPKPETPPKLAEKPTFKATPAKDTVAGISCRVVVELANGEPAIEHCMANKAALGITERETRTLARLFVLARERGWDWLGAATEDEEFVSVRSRRLDGDALWELGSVATDPLPQGHLRISREFTEIPYAPEPKASAAKKATEAAAAEQSAPEPEAATPADAPEKATPPGG